MNRLEPIDGRQDPPLLLEHRPHPVRVGGGQSPQLVEPVQQVGDRAGRQDHPAGGQFGVDLGRGPVGGVSAVAGERDDIEPELVVRESPSALGLGAERHRVQVAGGVPATADPQRVSRDARERGDGAEVGIVEVQVMATSHARGGNRRQGVLGGWGRTTGATGHRIPSVEAATHHPSTPSAPPVRLAGIVFLAWFKVW